MIYKVQRYSAFDNYTVRGCGENVSSIFDKLIRLAAKLTENYASDLLYELPDVHDLGGFEFGNWLYAFREGGVSRYDLDGDTVEMGQPAEFFLQYWRVHQVDGLTVLERVYLTEVR